MVKKSRNFNIEEYSFMGSLILPSFFYNQYPDAFSTPTRDWFSMRKFPALGNPILATVEVLLRDCGRELIMYNYLFFLLFLWRKITAKVEVCRSRFGWRQVSALFFFPPRGEMRVWNNLLCPQGTPRYPHWYWYQIKLNAE